MSEWIKCIDRLPIAYKNVLVTDGKSTWVASLQQEKNINVWWASHPDYKREYWNSNFPGMPFITQAHPTYWMPLPDAPKE